MAETVLLPQDKRIVIADREEIYALLRAKSWTDFACLLTAWNEPKFSEAKLTDVAKILLDFGCTYFLCVGELAEVAHDAIDGLIERRESTSKEGPLIVTTWHKEETSDEVINLFLHLSGEGGRSYSVLLAVLGDSLRDLELKRALRSFSSPKQGPGKNTI
jgi:hypothetical protein